MAYSGRAPPQIPPDKGSFPLDHNATCKSAMSTLMDCLRAHEHKNYPCKTLSKAYLECRMKNNLMTTEDLDEMGFAEKHAVTSYDETVYRRKEDEGFVGGLTVKMSTKEMEALVVDDTKE